MTRGEKRREYMRAYNKANRVRIAATHKAYYEANKDKVDAKSKEYASQYKDDFYTLYYLKEEHYIGITNQPKIRMYTHKSNGKYVLDYEVVSTFKTKREALDAESIFHDILKYRGSNKRKK
jgi:predicted GIY-YIG superfamily endonuclease